MGHHLEGYEVATKYDDETRGSHLKIQPREDRSHLWPQLAIYQIWRNP